MIYTSDNEIYEDETAHALGVKHPSTVDYQDHIASRMAPPGPTEPTGALKSDPGTQVPDKGTLSKTITIVRHGATHLNNDTNNSVDKIRGWSDVPLTDEGRDQAHKAGGQLEGQTIDSIHTSDLSRAHETAKIISSYVGVDPQPTDKLRPWDLGDFTGTSTKDSLPHIQDYAKNKPDKPVPGGESFNQFKDRAFQGLHEAMNASDNPLIVTHHRTERLLKAWDKAGQPGDHSIHMPTFLEKGEDTGKVEQMKVAMNLKDMPPESGLAIPEPLHNVLHALTHPYTPRSFYYGDTGTPKSSNLSKAAGAADIPLRGEELYREQERQRGEEEMYSARLKQWLERKYNPPNDALDKNYAEPPNRK